MGEYRILANEVNSDSRFLCGSQEATRRLDDDPEFSIPQLFSPDFPGPRNGRLQDGDSPQAAWDFLKNSLLRTDAGPRRAGSRRRGTFGGFDKLEVRRHGRS